MSNELGLDRRGVVRAGLSAAAFSIFGVRLTALGVERLSEGDAVLPFLDPQDVNPNRPMIHWPDLDSWITPNETFFAVSHYGTPPAGVLNEESWRLGITGLVDAPRVLTVPQIKARPRVEETVTIECSGNGASPRFMGAVGNAKWVGTPLLPILRECGLKPEAREIVFFGADRGTEKIREGEYEQTFGRSLGIADPALERTFLAWEMNGKPLEHGHGFPLRLVVPGWYGVAWVKWLNRIEVQDRRFMGKFMARDYVTIRGEKRGGETIWRETSVGPMRIKSIVARVVRRANGDLQVFGAAWNDGTPLQAVELKIDNGPWVPTKLHAEHSAKYAWTFWSHTWKNAPLGEHTLTSRAIDAAGNIQPAPDDPSIVMKKTYWEANQQVPRRVKV